MDLKLLDVEPTEAERVVVDLFAGMGRDQLLPALHAVNDRVGWISQGALNHICRVLHIPPAVKLGVAMPLMGFPFLLLSVSSAIPVVLLVIFLFVIGEMLWVPTSQSVVAGLAPAEARGAYMGAFGSGAAIGFALAPFIGLNIGDAYGDGTMWAFFALVSLVAAATGVIAARGVRDSAATEGLEPDPAVT